MFVAQATGGGFVDAGASAAAVVGETFELRGHVEGFASAPTTAWSGPAACAIEDASALRTNVTCSAGGMHDFTLGAGTASDVVRAHVTEVTTTSHVRVSVFMPAGALGVAPLGNTVREFQVPEGTKRLRAHVTWAEDGVSDLDLELSHGSTVASGQSASLREEIVVVDDPAPGEWTVSVFAFAAANVAYRLVVESERPAPVAVPALAVPTWVGAPGSVARLAASPSGGTPPYAIAWETDASSRRFDDGLGDTFDVSFTSATRVLAKVTDALGFETVAEAKLLAPADIARPFTVVAVIDSGFSAYHEDFLGAKHPWNVDADPANDFDFAIDPVHYVAGHPGATPLALTLPTHGDEDVDALRLADGAVWSTMLTSTASEPHVYWIPGTKVVGALRFGGSTFQSTNGAHGTASASVAAGNVHGSCPECLFVLVAGGNDESLRWVASQRWIDVVTNSYGAGGPVQGATLGLTRDNMYLDSPVDATRAASEDGQVIVFSAGNGFVNAFDVPMFTYWSSQKGPDWMVTVGAVAPDSEQTVLGAGKPVDISSIGAEYPASGGSTANGRGTHGGTSNAAPVVAGYFAKTLQSAREMLEDRSGGHEGGVVATGAPRACGAAWSACPLADGVLTRIELEDTVYGNVLPSPQNLTGAVFNPPFGFIPNANVPTTQFAYYYQGHGTLTGRLRGDGEYEQEWRRMSDALAGDVAPFARPEGEREWFVVDSKCRQRFWGGWTGGDYVGGDVALDVSRDPVAAAFDAWCSALPEEFGLRLRDATP